MEYVFRGQGHDGLLLDNVTFVNMTISYHGGPVILINVKFIHCRFRVDNSSRGEQLLAAAIEPEANAHIG